MVFFRFTKKKVILLLGFFSILVWAYFPLIIQKKYMRYSWEARIFINNHDFKPEEARELILKNGGGLNENYWGTRVFVIGNEYFFSHYYIGPFFKSLPEFGYYVNPITKEVREVKTSYSFPFPFLFDESSIDLKIEKKQDE